MRRFSTAIFIAILGTLVLGVLGQLLGGLVGDSYDLFGCFIGAFLASYMFANSPSRQFSLNFRPAVLLVFSVFVSISFAHAIKQIQSGVFGIVEAIVKFMWATLATSWWLIPAVTLVLTGLGRARR